MSDETVENGYSGPPPQVSVVIPTYREPAGVRRALLSLFEQDLPKDQYEILVVDSSPDDAVRRTVADLQADAPCTLRLLTKPAEGPGPSRHLGAGRARGAIIAFMDSDCRAAPQWLRHGIAAFANGVGIVQGRTLPEPDVPLGIFTWYVRIEQETFIYEGANIFYRKAAYDQVGGFAPEYCSSAFNTMGGEDLDLAWRVKRAGWASRFCAEALVYHEVQPIPVTRWLFIKRHHIWPRLAGQFPELRPHFFARYFFDRHQACLCLLLVGLTLAAWTPLALLLSLPYAISRGSEPTRTLTGPLRVIRVLVYLPRDVLSLILLAAGSLRYRSLLL